MIPLKYATASQEVPLGYFVDSTDGDTAETGLTIANTDIKIWKSGATTLADKNSGGATHISGGIYYCTLDDTDTDTYGPLKIFVHESGALPVVLECLVMEADAYDALMAAAGTGHIEADAVQISGDSTAANNLELDYDGTGYAKSNSTIGTTTTNTDLVTAAAVRAEIDSNSTQLAAIVADTNELQTDDIPGAIAGLNDLSAAQVNAEVDSALDSVIADSIPADGSRPSVRQGIYMVVQYLLERATSGTTVTVKKPDGATTLFTLDLDSGTAPTSITRDS